MPNFPAALPAPSSTPTPKPVRLQPSATQAVRVLGSAHSRRGENTRAPPSALVSLKGRLPLPAACFFAEPPQVSCYVAAVWRSPRDLGRVSTQILGLRPPAVILFPGFLPPISSSSASPGLWTLAPQAGKIVAFQHQSCGAGVAPYAPISPFPSAEGPSPEAGLQ